MERKYAAYYSRMCRSRCYSQCYAVHEWVDDGHFNGAKSLGVERSDRYFYLEAGTQVRRSWSWSSTIENCYYKNERLLCLCVRASRRCRLEWVQKHRCQSNSADPTHSSIPSDTFSPLTSTSSLITWLTGRALQHRHINMIHASPTSHTCSNDKVSFHNLFAIS